MAVILSGAKNPCAKRIDRQVDHHGRISNLACHSTLAQLHVAD
jgi:hypothetical protein